MLECSDNRLIEQYKSGDNNAFNLLYERYKNMIKSLARKFFLAGGDNDDLMQEGVLGLLNAVNTFNFCGQFSTYAYACIKNSIISAVLKAQSKKNAPLNASVSIEDGTQNKGVGFVDPEDQIISQEAADELMEKIKSNLSHFEKNVFKLYLEGLSYVEIGQRMNKEAKAVDNALQRIKRKISEIL